MHPGIVKLQQELAFGDRATFEHGQTMQKRIPMQANNRCLPQNGQECSLNAIHIAPLCYKQQQAASQAGYVNA